ncbi:MAG: hypothetical protein GMKNLPBB_02433 [Myxococcota bacterium]|nr:hypothetical protein [Myxococcota bacterium]
MKSILFPILIAGFALLSAPPAPVDAKTTVKKAVEGKAQVIPSQLLGSVIEEVKQAAAENGPTPIVIFDLDDTLFDNRERTLGILREYAAQAGVADSPTGRALRGLRPEHIEYGVEASVAKVGVTEARELEKIKSFWKPRFMGAWAVHDRTLPGAVDYVHRLHRAGALVVYLSGRDAPRMLQPTVQALQIAGFPVGANNTMLILKPDAAMEDEAFKNTVFPALRRLGKVLASFDNEPGNVNAMKAAYPDARVIFLATKHRPDAPPVKEGIPSVPDFRLE